ncbi:MAG: hypothetical protein R2747_10210 [Pyrinomonadaceae bacterium]
MKFRLIALLVVLSIPALAVAQKHAAKKKGNGYIGYQYTGVTYNQKLPNGVRDLGGSLLENENYGVSRMKKGKTEMLWLTRITGRNWSGLPNWQVKDVIYLPQLKENQEILQGMTFPCTINKKEDLNLIVLAELLPEKNSYSIQKAWRADTRTKKFEAVSTRGISCENEGDDGDG